MPHILGIPHGIDRSTPMLGQPNAITNTTKMIGKTLGLGATAARLPDKKTVKDAVQKADKTLEKAEDFESRNSELLDYGTAGLAAAPVPGARLAAAGLSAGRGVLKGSRLLRRGLQDNYDLIDAIEGAKSIKRFGDELRGKSKRRRRR